MINYDTKKRVILKAFFGLILLAWGTAFIAGCDDNNDHYIIHEDNTPPAVPRGLYSVTGDEAVYLYWYPNTEVDFDFYAVYRSTVDLSGPYSEIGTTTDPEFVDFNVVNGNTYFYAVTAVDDALNESDLSYEDVFDTPRPEGTGVRVYDRNSRPEVSAFDFSTHHVVGRYDPDADIWFDIATVYSEAYDADITSFYINAANYGTDIQDYGYTGSLDDVNYSPTVGWNEVGYLELIPGHSYIVWTSDNHFAKIRVTDIDFSSGSLRFDWAYQVDEGNPELKVVPKIVPERPEGYGDVNFVKR
jgi:hypothetical protein